MDDILIDYWAHEYADNPRLHETEVLETEDFDAEVAAMDAEVGADPAGDDFETVESETFEIE